MSRARIANICSTNITINQSRYRALTAKADNKMSKITFILSKQYRGRRYIRCEPPKTVAPPLTAQTIANNDKFNIAN